MTEQLVRFKTDRPPIHLTLPLARGHFRVTIPFIVAPGIKDLVFVSAQTLRDDVYVNMMERLKGMILGATAGGE